MALSPARIRQFHDQGYLVLPQVVPQHLILRAVRAINHSLGHVGLPPAELPKYRSQSYCPELCGSPALEDLARVSPLPQLLEALLGAGNVLPIGSAQIALRFPSALDTDPSPPVGHLDGIGTDINGLPKGTFMRGFAALAVVLLQDLPEGNSGNFTVWPGSHLAYAAFFREHGFAVLQNGTPTIPLPHPAHMITGRAGDVVIAHHNLLHTAAANASPHIRYAAIYRVRHVATATIGAAAVMDLWREWDGVRAVMAKG